MIVIDTNALVILVLGLMDPRLIEGHKRTSIYDMRDFDDLLVMIGDVKQLVIIPNVWTEVDNLLNGFTGQRKDDYVAALTELIPQVAEEYITTSVATTEASFYDLGITDSLLLQLSRNYDLLITGDSQLSDYAKANGVEVYDIVEERNTRL